jgi:hypothetical protein
MGRLEELLQSPKAKDWGYHDARRLASLRLDKEFRDSLECKPIQSTIVESLPDNSLKREVRLQAEEIVRLRNSVTLLTKKGGSVKDTDGSGCVGI